MSRPTTKTDLIEAANTQFDKLWQVINSMTEDEQSAEFNFSADFLKKQKEAHWGRDRNLRDVLTHLYEWHQLLLNWVKSNQNGEPKPFLPAPYNWKTYSQMNAGFWEKHQATTYESACEMLKDSHAEVMASIETFSNDELFSKRHFSWTGTSTLGSYCVSATSSHYDWAMKKIKRHIKAYRNS
jgi:hypothetical protein